MKKTNELMSIPSLPLAEKHISLNRWYDVWLSNYKRGRVKPTTLDTYSAVYDRHLRYTIGEHALDEFHPIHIQKLYNDFLNSGYTATYLNTVHAILNNLFRTALINELIPTNPCSLVERPSGEASERRVLTPSEQKTLMNAVRQPRFRQIEPVVTTLLGTGLRIGELLGLCWSDVAMTPDNVLNPTGYLCIRRTLVRVKNEGAPGTRYLLQAPKTKKSIRTIPLQQSVYDALIRQADLQSEYRRRPTWSSTREFDGLVFSGKTGNPQWRSTIVSKIDTVIRKINEIEIRQAQDENRPPDLMDPILPHTFRHTFATRCLEAGIPPKIVQGWLGHASIKITLDLYTHVSPDLSAGYMHALETSLAASLQ